MLNRDEIRARTLFELREALRRQQQRGWRPRRPVGPVDPTPLALDTLQENGVRLPWMRGPWRVASVEVRRRGRDSQPVPCVERGRTCLLVPSDERARELAGLLNWCEVEEGELVD